MFCKVFVVCLILCASTSVDCSKLRAAPYLMPLDNNPPDISEAIKASGIKHYILAFVLGSSKGGCIPTWDGNPKQKVSDDTKVLKIIETIRSAGGDVSVSFGGYSGLELGNAKACPDAQQLADAYQSVIDKYQLTNIDLDIEGDDLGDDASEHKRFAAIKILKERAKAKGKELFVSLTLPSTSVGLSDLARDEMRKAVNDGVVIDLYKVMAFDYGGDAAEQVQSVTRVMEFAHQQIKLIRTELNDKQVYAVTGLILMNGHTDQATELYELDDFDKLVQYAKDKELGRVSFWSLNRDRPCGNLKVGWVSGVCSSIQQIPFEYSKLLSKFESDGNPTPTTSAPTKVTVPQTTAPPTKPQSTTQGSHVNLTTVDQTKSSKVETSVTEEVNTTTPYVSTSRVTFSPIIDDVDCRKAADNAHFPYKNDCTEYIRCYNRLAHLEVCPKGTIYDTKLHICNWPQSVDRPECK